MAKALIVYDSKYGNTKRLAEAVLEGMQSVPGIEVTIRDVKEAKPNEVAGFDALIIGSPNHIGNAAKSIRKFIDGLGEPDLKGKSAAVFDTYMGGDFEKAVKSMKKQLSEKAPGLKLLAPSLSILVKGMKGPIADGEIPKGKEFGIKIAKALKESAKS